MELYCYVVKKPDEPPDLSRLRRDPRQAWCDYLAVDEPDDNRLARLVSKEAILTGVRCCCYRLVPSGMRDVLG